MIVATELYRGAATYYARHGLTYPEDFFRSLVRICNLSNRTRALDLGAGTGQVAIPLARTVASVLFVDPSDEMVREGKRAAEAAGAKNIDFVVSRSEDIDEPTSSFDIATVAGSFLWMNQIKVLAKLAQLLKPEGCVVITNRERDGSEPGGWYAAMMSDIKEFWGGSFPAGPGAVRPILAPSREVLRASDFSDITELRHYYEHHWYLDDLLGYLYSSSLAAPGTLGARHDEFTTRMRRLLLSYSPSGSFVERGHHTTLLGYRP
ncbi:class I SAM-dependent methyltransferase [Bradyrhizobium barranii]|uniref:class I SAM-dependent methyltransferase n=1 Tax=Bradyrhizobium barranii TaxID=2992140 RepID=UPI0024B0756C|nr:class I SAM-dependent methyltransferase [Bradyrhizobium barranii]WFT97108.1 class I SAM-dependent methyltransferase [Bradyrhizobium barranii]